MPENCRVGSFLETAMRGLILALAGGLALAASVQAAPLAPNPASIELGAAPSVELVRDNCGRGWHRTRWRDQWAIGSGATVFRMRVPTTPGAQAGTIANQIGPPWGSVVRNLVGARSQAGEKA